MTWDNYHRGALAISTPDSFETRRYMDNEIQFRSGVAAAINDHAVMIDELNKRMGDMVAFIEWVGNTHPHVLQEHQAIKDLEEASK